MKQVSTDDVEAEETLTVHSKPFVNIFSFWQHDRLSQVSAAQCCLCVLVQLISFRSLRETLLRFEGFVLVTAGITGQHYVTILRYNTKYSTISLQRCLKQHLKDTYNSFFILAACLNEFLSNNWCAVLTG